MKIYRQGDVLLIATEDAPALGRMIPRDAGRIVLAYGETTGHAHAIADPEAELYEMEQADLADRFLRVLAQGGVSLTHEEHDSLALPQGDYVVRRQREATPWGERQVRD